MKGAERMRDERLARARLSLAGLSLGEEGIPKEWLASREASPEV